MIRIIVIVGVLVIVIIAILLLSSCSAILGEGRMERLGRETIEEKQIADARLNQVIEAIQSRDKDALKAMFSQQAQANADNLDGCIEYIFGFIEGEITEIDDVRGGPASGGTLNYGHYTQREINSHYIVETDTKKYDFRIRETIVDTDHPENVGVYSLCIIATDDDETQYGPWLDMEKTGIYKPKGE